MKRILYILTAALLLAGLAACAAPAQPAAEATAAPVEVQPAAEPTAAQEAPVSLPEPAAGMTRLLSEAADLDGDGTDEYVLIDSDDEQKTTVTVVSGDTSVSADIDYPYLPRLYKLHALWGDATKQIIVSGDTGSDDYTTWIFRYENAALKSVELDGYPEELRSDGTLLIGTNVDILGTYGATCVYTVGQDLSAVRSSDFEIVTYDGFETERLLTVKKDGLSAKTVAGETVALPVGTTLLIVSTNLSDTARCSTSLGEDVLLSVTRPPEAWQWFIDGIAEDEWFGELLYAG